MSRDQELLPPVSSSTACTARERGACSFSENLGAPLRVRRGVFRYIDAPIYALPNYAAITVLKRTGPAIIVPLR